MIRYWLSLVIALNLFTFPSIAFTEDEVNGDVQGNDTDSNESIESGLRNVGIEEVNRLLQNQFPFINLGYADHGEDDNDVTGSGFVLSYDWHKDWDTLDYIGDGSLGQNYAALIYRGSIFAKGSVGLGDAIPQQNQSEMGFALSFRQANFDDLVSTLTPESKEAVTKCQAELTETLSEEQFNTKFDECIKENGIFELIDVNHINQFQWVYGIDANVKLETDEDFSEKHYVYGLELSAALNPPEDHPLSYLNVPDLPFMLTRKIFGVDSRFQPTLPIVRASIQYVDAQDDEKREAVAPDDDSFTRFFGEAAFTTLVCSIEGKPIKFNAAYRYYQELNADDRVKNADLDVFHFFSASIQVPAALLMEKVSDTHMFYVRFTDGELPFDEESNTSVEFGWSANINLGGLIAN